MLIRVKIIKENPDGSADAKVTVDKEGMQFLLQEGFTAVLLKVIEREKANVSKRLSSRRKPLRKKGDPAVGLHTSKQDRVSRRKHN